MKNNNELISLCIPRIHKNITEKKIYKVLNEIKLGIIDHIDLISKNNEKGQKQNRAYIHYKEWYKNENATIAMERLKNGKEIKIMYDETWYWKISMYRKPTIKLETKN